MPTAGVPGGCTQMVVGDVMPSPSRRVKSLW